MPFLPGRPLGPHSRCFACSGGPGRFRHVLHRTVQSLLAGAAGASVGPCETLVFLLVVLFFEVRWHPRARVYFQHYVGFCVLQYLNCVIVRFVKCKTAAPNTVDNECKLVPARCKHLPKKYLRALKR